MSPSQAVPLSAVPLPARVARTLEQVLARGSVMERAPLQSGAEPPRANEPLRVHAEWSADGVRVWLGVDAELVLPSTLEPILNELRRHLEASGAPLVTLVCNGRVAWDGRTDSHPAHVPPRRVAQQAAASHSREVLSPALPPEEIP